MILIALVILVCNETNALDRPFKGLNENPFNTISNFYTPFFKNAKSWLWVAWIHYNDVIMSAMAMASQITSITNVYSTVHSGANQSKHQSSASLASVRGIHRWPVNSPHKEPVTRKMFPFADVILQRGDWLWTPSFIMNEVSFHKRQGTSITDATTITTFDRDCALQWYLKTLATQLHV